MFGRLPGTGPKLAFNSHEMSYLIALTKKYPKSGSNKLSLMLKEKKNIDISPRTIRRYLFDSGLKGRIAVKKPFLSKANKNVRFEMAKEWLNMTNNDWEKIIWSDETKINLFGSDGKQYVRRLDGTRYENNHMSSIKHYGSNVKVWGCFSSKEFENIHIIDGIMDSIYYLNILQYNLKSPATKLELNEFNFQQDNNPKHISAIIKSYFQRNNINVLPWPSQSPDMNPIEHLWGYLKTRVSERLLSNIKQLKSIIKQEWEAIPKELCQKLMNSVERRVEALFKAKGNHTKY